MHTVVSERIGLALDDCHSIHVWSSSPRTDILGHSQSSLRDFSLAQTQPAAGLPRSFGALVTPFLKFMPA